MAALLFSGPAIKALPRQGRHQSAPPPPAAASAMDAPLNDLADIARQTHSLHVRVNQVLRQCSLEAHDMQPSLQAAMEVVLKNDALQSRISRSVTIPLSEYFVFDHANNAYDTFEAFDYTLIAFSQRTVAGTIYHPDVIYRDTRAQGPGARGLPVFKLLNNHQYGDFDNAAFLDITYVLDATSGRRLPVIVYNI